MPHFCDMCQPNWWERYDTCMLIDTVFLISDFQFPDVIVKGTTPRLWIAASWSFEEVFTAYDVNRTNDGAVYTGFNFGFWFCLRVDGGPWQQIRYFDPYYVPRIGYPWDYENLHAIPWIAQRGASYTFPINIPDLPIGMRSLEIAVKMSAAYDLDGKTCVGYQTKSLSSVTVEVVDGSPTCSFTASQLTGEAPVSIDFADTSTVPLYPGTELTSWLWNFGDGTSSALQNPSHTYTRAGNFQVSLTVSNQFGSHSASRIIQVFEREAWPIFSSDTWFPDRVHVDEPFTPTIIIKNQGGAGRIYVEWVFEGKTYELAKMDVGGYSEYEYLPDAHTISWWMKRTPTEPEYINITLRVGVVGKEPVDSYIATVGVFMDDGPHIGDTKCVGYDLWEYTAAGWKVKKKNATECGYTPELPEDWTKYLPYALIGGGVLLLGGALWRRKK